MNSNAPLSRRRFLRQKGCAALGLLGVVNSLAQMRLIHSAAAQKQYNDYKALVCIFLYGGNDANNMIIPMGPEYGAYQTARGVLAIPESDLHTIPPAQAGGRAFGMHPNLGIGFNSMPSIHQLFTSGKAAVIGNVGTLVEPTTQSTYLNKSVALPPQLFSHSNQQLHWQSSVPDQPFSSGWGGRVASLVSQMNAETAQTSMSVSLAGHNEFMVGNDEAAVQFHLRPQGPVTLAFYGAAQSGDYTEDHHGMRLRVFDNIMGEAMNHLFQEEFRTRVLRARANNSFLIEALNGIDETVYTGYPTFPNSGLADQLKMIARMIAARDALGQKRQLFFAAISGFDTHANQLQAHANLMTEVSEALGAFHQATVALGVEDKVTTFTASDFGRTYTPNGITSAAGSDHAWGGHSFVVGGAVQGSQIYGTMPNLVLGSEDDTETTGANQTSRGRWIPSTSVDEYAATLAKWYGLTNEQLATVFPNLHRFDTPDLGFMG